MACDRLNMPRGDCFEKVLSLPWLVVNYLVDNAPNFWKLLYYNKPEDIPRAEVDLDKTQISNMICSTPQEMYDTNISTTKNILFQAEMDEAFFGSVPQVRIFSGDKTKINIAEGYTELNFQIVVPNKQLLCYDVHTEAPMIDRADAIVSELMQALDRTVIPNSVVNSPLFMNRSAPNGAGRSTGCKRSGANKNFSQEWLTLAVLI